jgi:hypothetical protein
MWCNCFGCLLCLYFVLIAAVELFQGFGLIAIVIDWEIRLPEQHAPFNDN